MANHYLEDSICEQFINVEIVEEALCEETDVNVIGASLNTSLRGTLFTGTDGTTIYCDSLNGNDSNAGTSASPKLTLSASFVALGSTKRRIQLKDDTLPYELDPEWIPTVSATSMLQMQSALGEACQVYLTQKSALKTTLTPPATSLYDHAHIDAFTQSGTYITTETNSGYLWDGTTLTTPSTVAGYTHNKTWKGVTVYTHHQNGGIIDKTTLEITTMVYTKADYLGLWLIGYYIHTSTGLPWIGANGINYTPNIDIGSILDNTDTTGTIDYCIPTYMDGIYLTFSRNFSMFYIQKENETTNYIYYTRAYYTTPSWTQTLQKISKIEQPKCCDCYNGTTYIGSLIGIYSYNINPNVTPVGTAPNYINEKEIYLEPADASECTAIGIFYYNNDATLSSNDRIYAGRKNGQILEYKPYNNSWSNYLNIGYEIKDIECKRIEGLFSVMYVTDVNNYLYRIDMNNKTWSKCNPSITAYDITYWNKGNNSALDGFYILNTAWGLYKKYESIDIPQPSQFCGINFEPYKDKHAGFRLCNNEQEINIFKYCDINNTTNHIFWDSDTGGEHYIDIYNNNLSNTYYGTYLITDETDITAIGTGTKDITYHDNNVYNVIEIGLCGTLVDTHVSYTPLNIYNNNFYNMKTAIRNTSDLTGGAALTVSANNFLNITEYFVDNISSYLTSLSDNVVYNCNLNTANCTENTTYPTIYQHPLFRNIYEGEEDFHLKSQCTGELFDSPSIRTVGRDVGAHNVTRTTYPAYSTIPLIKIDYKPDTMEMIVEKSNEELTSNFEGTPHLLARPIQSKTLKFDYTDANYQGYTDPYDLLYLHGCNNHKLRLWFHGLKGIGDITLIDANNWDYVLNASLTPELTDVNVLMPNHEIVRPYLKDEGYTDEDIFYVIGHTYNQTTYPEYKWQLNQWQGWYITFLDDAFEYEFTVKIRFSYDKYIYILKSDCIDQHSDYAPIDDSSGNFYISYYQCILKTTQQYAKKRKLLSVEPNKDEAPLNTGTLEFIEA